LHPAPFAFWLYALCSLPTYKLPFDEIVLDS
jgi:hypothetical protein